VTQANSNSPLSVIVGIGASAGGVEAVSSFFDHELGSGHAAFVVVMHLAPGRVSHLPDILSRHTSMPVQFAEDGMAIEAGQVYVLPPAVFMTVKGDQLRLTPLDTADRLPTVIDRFFNSLAQCCGQHAIGVVLSGTGADGALGLKAIKERGGLTIAQGEDGSAPLFSGMPQSAVSIGAIDAQLPVEDIPARLAKALDALADADSANALADQESLRKEICVLLRDSTGHDFSGYKPNTFFRRVQRRMHVRGVPTAKVYLETLKEDPAELTALFRDLLISVTSFFRDTESFEVLERDVVPAIFRNKKGTDEVRVWVSGCATGEEAYTLGMLLLEYADKVGGDLPRIRVFATDIDEYALTIARNGRYPSVLMDAVSPERRKAFFTESHDHLAVNKRLRGVCTFSPHNALQDPPFSRIDLASCRNLLIYLDVEFQDRVMPILHYALRPDGYLFMGMAEGATRFSTLFAPVSKAHRIFRKLPGSDGNIAQLLLPRDGSTRAARTVFAKRGDSAMQAMRKRIEARVLQVHTPPYVLVTPQGEALFYSGRTGPFLEFSPGAPSRQLLNNARKELRLGLRRALHQASRTRQRVILPEINIKQEDGLRRVQVRIDPFEDGETPLYLVLFNDLGPSAKGDEAGAVSEAHTVQQLEHDLRDAREELQSTYEEFETALEELRVANEELMSVNEELQSSNEELETSKEELQSVNEELQTVNHEMTHHMEALDQSNADLHGLLESTGIATIFLDQQLVIRRYTQAATEIFTLIPNDCGRRIGDLNHYLERLDLPQALADAQNNGQPVQLFVRRKDHDKYYLMCLLPYRGHAGSGGLVMTFVDVTELALAEVRHKTMIGELNHRVRNMLAVVSAMAQQTLAREVEPAVLDPFLSRLFAIARTYKLLTDADWVSMALDELLRGELGSLAGPERFQVGGPRVRLNPREALAVGMVFHELATNALKYGALSNSTGRVEVHWSQSDEPEPTLEIRWEEHGGPPVNQPTRRGFGTLLLERQLAYELHGRSTVEYTTKGLRAEMSIPRLAQPEELTA
jgi:two-component system CheB/CheR fusion protein